MMRGPIGASGRAVAYDIEMPAPIFVPSTFFGINSQDWPVRAVTSGGNGSSAPGFGFGTLATIDCPPLHWDRINTADGVYNWAALDAAVNEMTARGGVVLYVLYGTPTWLAQSGQAGIAGPYGGLGEGSFPNNLSKLAVFCTALMQRYNSGKNRKIPFVQILNEPELNNFSGAASAFWWGTASQFVDTLNTAYAALKAADPGVICLSPGTYDLAIFETWGATLGLVTGRYGKESYDAVALHPYNSSPTEAVYEGYPGTFQVKGSIESIGSGTRRTRRALSSLGRPGLEIHVTEWGISSAAYSLSAATQAYMGVPAAQRRKYMARLLVAAAAAGIKSFSPYSYGNLYGNCAGNLANDPGGIPDGYQDAYTAMVNKTIVGRRGHPDGSLSATFSDGSVYTV